MTAIAPEDLSLAGRRLWDQVGHLEPDDGTYPFATVCAMLAKPVDPLYDLVAGGDDQWAPAFDPDLAAEVLDPDTAVAFMRWMGQFAGLTLSESMNLLQQRVTLTTSSAAKRGSPEAIKGAVRAHLVGPDGDPASATVYLTERIGDDPYWFAVATLASETSDPDAVERALLLNVGEPDGARKWTYAVIAGGSYADLLATHADYAEVTADFADYDAVRADPSDT